jgi:hypothetical protein
VFFYCRLPHKIRQTGRLDQVILATASAIDASLAYVRLIPHKLRLVSSFTHRKTSNTCPVGARLWHTDWPADDGGIDDCSASVV